MIEWIKIKDKSYTPPIQEELLVAHTRWHWPEVSMATFDGESWKLENDGYESFRDGEIHYWARKPKPPKDM